MMLGELYGFAALLCAVGFLWSVLAYSSGKKQCSVDATRSEHFFEATVARQLVPRFSQIVERGDRVVVVGDDACYVDSIGGPHLFKGFEEWIERGASICYLIISSHPSSCASLVEFSKRHPGSFSLKFASQYRGGENWVEKAVDSLKFSHPSFIERGDRSIQAVWFEGYHASGSHIARDVDYISAKDIDSTEHSIPFVAAARHLIDELPSHASGVQCE
ncbi:hypothetical protein [Nioella sp.]|uniref:hypothetical protein n=1 Tax=Nioella sp. TaxID=1912091 RepID=UPI003A85C11C